MIEVGKQREHMLVQRLLLRHRKVLFVLLHLALATAGGQGNGTGVGGLHIP